MAKNPAFGAAVPSVAGPTVIEASLPVTQTAGTLGDLADILESEIQVVDITSNFARVIAPTTVDVACAVAFGKTTDYGNLAVDSDMGGGGHADHGPQLTGLEPDTIYQLTFGGIGPDGTVYGYKDLTFRTKPADAGTEQNTRGENLALAVNGGRVSSVSSNYGSPSLRRQQCLGWQIINTVVVSRRRQRCMDRNRISSTFPCYILGVLDPDHGNVGSDSLLPGDYRSG